MKTPQNTVHFRARGRTALFSDTVTRQGGDKTSYRVPTYEALKGIMKSVYWKPTFIWVIDRVRVMNKIRFQPVGILTPGNALSTKSTADRAFYNYLYDVDYQVEAHFEWNMNHPQFEQDRNHQKHLDIAKRLIRKGGNGPVFGVSECFAYITPCAFGEDDGFYDNTGIMNFGAMYHGIGYPDETLGVDQSKGAAMMVRHFRKEKPVIMEDGIICFPPPNDISSLVSEPMDAGRIVIPKVFENNRVLVEEE